MTVEEEIQSLKQEVAELKEVVKHLTEALKVSVNDNKKAKAYVDKVDELISKL